MKLRIGWILSGSETVPGARIQGFNIHRQLVQMGVESTILHAPEKYDLSITRTALNPGELADEGYSVIIFQKVFEGDSVDIVKDLKSQGIKTIYLSCELCGHNMVKTCDQVIAVSPFLKSAYGRSFARKIRVIPDALEVAEDVYKKDYELKGSLGVRPFTFPPESPEKSRPDPVSPREVRKNERLRAVYLSSALPDKRLLAVLSSIKDDNSLSVISSGYEPENDDKNKYHKPLPARLRSLLSVCPLTTMDRVVRRLGYRKVAARFPDSEDSAVDYNLIPWSIDTVSEDIIKHDIAVIPCDLTSDHNMSKSSNRLTMMMALGMPTIVSPLPAYLDVIEQGRNGFVASTPAEWRGALNELKSAKVRERVGQQARADVINKFSVQTIAKQYLDVFTARG